MPNPVPDIIIKQKVGCNLEEDALKALVRYISENAGIQSIRELPGAAIIRREKCTILLNYNDVPVETGVTGRSLLTDRPFDGLLPGYGME